METGARGAAPRLLYVEDDRVIAEMTIEVLSETYEVTHVTDGRHALERALSERFDVMVIDRRLPDLDGASLVASVRTARITTPILLLTALGAVADERRATGDDAEDIGALDRVETGVKARRDLRGCRHRDGVRAEMGVDRGGETGRLPRADEIDMRELWPAVIQRRAYLLRLRDRGLEESAATEQAAVHVARFRDEHFPVPPQDQAKDDAEAAAWNGYLQ